MKKVVTYDGVVRRTVRVALVLIILLASMTAGGYVSTTNAQDEGSDTSTPVGEQTAPVEVAPEPSPTNVATIEPTAVAPSDPVELPAEEATVSTPPTEAPPEETASPATLAYWPDSSAHCAPSNSAQSEALSAGGFLDYQCTYAISISGIDVAIHDVAASFSVTAVVPEGLTLRYRTNAYDELAWGEPNRYEAVLNDAAIEPDAVTYDSNADSGVSGNIILSFFVRIERDQCSVPVGDIALTTSGWTETPNRDDVILSVIEPAAASTFLAPALTSLSSELPTARMTDLVITPVRFSLEDQVTNGSLTVQVDSLSYLCRAVQLDIAINRESSHSVTLQAITPLDGVVVAYLQEPGTSLNEFVAVGFLPQGTAAGTFSLTLSFDLTVPGGLMVGSFTVTASALVHLQSD